MPILTIPSVYAAASELYQSWFGTQHDAMFAVFVMWLSTEITFWSVNMFFYFIEVKGWFAKYKLHKEATDREQFKETLLHKPITYLVDVPIYWMSYKMTGIFHTNPPSPHCDLPGIANIFVHVAICTLTFDFMFYCWHRSLHTGPLWRFHKKHHEVKICYASANDHESVLEVTGNILWKMIPPAVLGSHVYTVCIFRSVVKFFALLHHSGYELPVFQPLQTIPFISSPSDHDFHHYNGHGNYGGVFMIWDHLGGTHRTWDQQALKVGKRRSLINTLSQREKVAVALKDFTEVPDAAAALMKMTG
jgi:sterol desaturase/sphingolipid hydroxylase (fatty acid hydroxylase superfamily)